MQGLQDRRGGGGAGINGLKSIQTANMPRHRDFPDLATVSDKVNSDVQLFCILDIAAPRCLTLCKAGNSFCSR